VYKYEIIVYWSNDDQVYIADVPELPGCMAHEDTPEVAPQEPQERISRKLLGYGLTPRSSMATKCLNRKDDV